MNSIQNRWLSATVNRSTCRLVYSLIILLITLLLLTMIGCDRSSKTIKLKLKLKPGLETVYNHAVRSKQIVLERDSVLAEASHERLSLYTETVDSLSGDTASWVTAKSEMKSQHYTSADTTVTETDMTIKQYQYLGKETGEILSLIPISGVDQKWADNQLENLKQMQPTFPQSDITVGHSWTKTIKVLLFDETREATGVYTLKSFVRERGYDCAVIEYEGHYHMPVDVVEDIVKITGISTITTKGTIYFAYREGIMVEDKVWWVFNSDRRVEYIAESEKGFKIGDIRYINIVTEGDTRTTLTAVTFPETDK